MIRTRIPLGGVRAVRPVPYAPFREFGGWGVRLAPGKNRAWTARGDQAVVLELDDGREVYVGSQRPQRLARRIRAAAGLDLNG